MITGKNFKEIVAESPYVFVIGVAGDSGSGKTTFTRSIRHIFGDELVSTITLDDYHIYDRKEREKRNITPLSPAANDLLRLSRDVALLRKGESILKMVYNHEKGTIEGPVRFPPSKILILEGLHPFATPELRELVDFSVYVDPAPAVKREWKLKRDIEKRGYSEREVTLEMARRESDYRNYVAPQREVADSVISIDFSRYGREIGWMKNIYRISLTQPCREGMPASAGPVIPLGGLFPKCDHNFFLEYVSDEKDGKKTATLSIDGEMSDQMVRGLRNIISHETGISYPEQDEPEKIYTATDFFRMFLSWKIIDARMAIESG
jgi:phosphoribulokinase